MTTAIILTFCILLLIAYVFDLTASKTKIPSVILLLLLGWIVRQATTWLQIELPDISPVLPVLGTIGLVLIVLEGSLELELNRSKFSLVTKSFLVALVPMLALAFTLMYLFHQYGNFGLKDSLTNAIPLCVISSAIAIPSVRNLSSYNREFVIYESSLSDIIGVTIFNFIALNEIINTGTFGMFILQLIIITIISLIATLGLSFLLNKIEHPVKFGPIVLLVVLIYTLSKIYHLPSLIFILIFGLTLGNVHELKKLKWFQNVNLEALGREVKKFKEITTEGAFIIRALFFLLFGYLIKTEEVLNPNTFVWALGIVFLIFIFRAILLKLSKLPLQPLLFVAPRGLITILLFLSIDPSNTISLVNGSLIIQVIIVTSLLMMFGLMAAKTQQSTDEQKI